MLCTTHLPETGTVQNLFIPGIHQHLVKNRNLHSILLETFWGTIMTAHVHFVFPPDVAKYTEYAKILKRTGFRRLCSYIALWDPSVRWNKVSDQNMFFTRWGQISHNEWISFSSDLQKSGSTIILYSNHSSKVLFSFLSIITCKDISLESGSNLTISWPWKTRLLSKGPETLCKGNV